MSFLTYLKELNDFKKSLQNNQLILSKIKCAEDALVAYSQKQIPKKLENFSLDPDYIFQHLNQYPSLLALDDLLADFRQICIENFGIWHLFDQNWLLDLAHFLNNQNTLELMAGNALISSQLKNVTASDNFFWDGQDIQKPDPWCFVKQQDAFFSVQESYQDVNNIILSWCPETVETDWQILAFLRQHNWQGNFIVIADSMQESTNSKAFWQNAKLTINHELNQHHPQIDYINDKVFLVK